MIVFAEEHRDTHGFKPICKFLPIAPSTCRDHASRRRDPARRSARAKRDDDLKVEIHRVFDANFRVYGARKVWRQLACEGIDIAQYTVARLMRELGLKGAVRGKTAGATLADKAKPCPLDRVDRQFHAPAPDRVDWFNTRRWLGPIGDIPPAEAEQCYHDVMDTQPMAA